MDFDLSPEQEQIRRLAHDFADKEIAPGQQATLTVEAKKQGSFTYRCRFHPSCSDYARIAVTRFGPWRGSLLAGWRLLRCQPLCEGGEDPVPERFHFSRCRHRGHSPEAH